MDVLSALRRSALFETCSGEELGAIVEHAEEVVLADGELLFSEEDRADCIWVVVSGDLVIKKSADGEEVMLDHLRTGDYLGEISLLTAEPARHRARAYGEVRLLRIPGDDFRALMHACRAVMETVVRSIASRMRRVEALMLKHERMAGLGTIAAGLAHELNNPAAAANRAADQLQREIDGLAPLARRLAEHPWDDSEVELLRRLEQATAAPDQDARELAPVLRADRESAVETWLESHEIEDAFELAPMLVERGVDVAMLDRLSAGCARPVLVDALDWTRRLAAIRQLAADLGQSTARIREMVTAVKAYSYLDTSTRREVDVREGIEQSLTILSHRLRESKATVVREFDRSLPPVPTFGTELVQVWTNLIDNAADSVAAMGGGTIRVRTSRDGDGIAVQVADTGGGIAPEHRARIFDPFFTTKGAGQGTGLGLGIVKRIVQHHGGRIDVESSPGETTVTVTLPVERGDPLSSRAERGITPG